MAKKVHWRKIGLILAAAIVMLSVTSLLSAMKHTSRDDDIIPLNQGWTIWLNELKYENQTLDDFDMLRNLRKGDKVILEQQLPDELDEAYTLYLLIYLSKVDVTLDDELIYTYGHEELENGKQVGSGYHFVQLPLDAEGKIVRITYTAGEDVAFTNIPDIELVPTAYVLTHFATHNSTAVFISIFLSILGTVAIIISLVALCFSNSFLRLLLIGILSLLVGIWAMCNTKTLQIFSVNLTINTTLEYIVLYVAPIPLGLLVLDMRRDARQWKKGILIGTCLAAAAFTIIATVLHITDICHFPGVVSVYHVLGLLILLAILIGGLKPIANMDATERLLNLGLIVFGVSAAVDVLRFNLQKYVLPDNDYLATSVLPMGAFLFIVLLVVSYLVYLYSMIMDKTEKDLLTVMAYKDSLTGLYNRAKCEEEFAALNSTDRDYTIVSIDLNGLKITNDTYGHAQGDLLLTSYAKILENTLGKIGLAIRMGGDEFVVIVQEQDISKINEALKHMVVMEEECSKEYVFNIEAAYGVARKSECDGHDAEAVYRMADARMYEMKIASKKADNV